MPAYIRKSLRELSVLIQCYSLSVTPHYTIQRITLCVFRLLERKWHRKLCCWCWEKTDHRQNTVWCLGIFGMVALAFCNRLHAYEVNCVAMYAIKATLTAKNYPWIMLPVTSWVLFRNGFIHDIILQYGRR